jgi:hypothetical protein
MSMILLCWGRVDVQGRGTGKSYGVGMDMHLINGMMPRSITTITGKTYAQVLTRTLPSTFKFLETLGYIRDVHYVINKKPPKYFNEPYEKVLKYDNFITFQNGTGYLLLSQDRSGTSRGPNTDFEIIDEALTIDKVQYDTEVSPTNRGNEMIFGKRSKKPVAFHHGFHYVSSMPISQDGNWLLEYAKYYEAEAGIRLFQTWNRIIKLQIELLGITDQKEFKSLWNEIIRIKNTITPFVSKNKILFLLSNAFENLQNVGLSYIRREYEKLNSMVFLIEIMNMIIDKVQDCYYAIDPDRHIYYTADNLDYIQGVADNTNFDFNQLAQHDSRYDQDCNPDVELEISFDWGSSISVLCVSQESQYDFVTKLFQPTDNFIKEFFVKPEGSNVLIDALVDQFSDYYSCHHNKTLYYYKDKYGDQQRANSSQTYNQQAIDRLTAKGWDVVLREHKGQEPPHHQKFQLWGNILKENNPAYPRIRFNGNNCKYMLISLNNTEVIDKDGKFEKNKRSEVKKSNIPPEEATHFSDACDKKVWTKYGSLLSQSGHSFIPARL